MTGENSIGSGGREETEDVSNALAPLCVPVMPIQHFSANLIEWRSERMAEKERARLMKDQRKVAQHSLLLSFALWVHTL